ncbi:thiamine pyrophosphate-binding protein [Arthrobacter sp. MI7-26]|uniref:thiamine pyrophosphate-dependent enzyme n=1 Tax=Arthrobacter sp. MI7-26 TaxID=2993653 RepID=UPI0022492382|nr:thiamine pyrophosphate-dependent enzyme [Arthrobacter sp. MI7-26]MCX2746858.1 thiamine pyrophosphate-binding protein [Arthrobacter sp. MI7-26]
MAAPTAAITKSAGHVIVDSLAAHGVKRVYCVPGESYLDVLDGLHDAKIQTIVCRHEGGAAYMAEAEGKLSQVPGVAMVTRGPGAANAFVAVHTAWQDATPMVLFVGLIPVADRERESFQEFDIKAWFGTGAKRVLVLDSAERASEIVAEAFFAAASGRPGPVVVGLPEDVITHRIGTELHPVIPVAGGGVSPGDAAVLKDALQSASKPLFITGGNDWTRGSSEKLTSWLEGLNLPAASDWRANGVVSSDSPSYVGSFGYGRDDSVAASLSEADLVVTIGTVLGDVLTDGFTLRQDWSARNIIVNIDTSLRGRSGGVHHQIVAKPGAFVDALAALEMNGRPEWKDWTAGLRNHQENYARLNDAAVEHDVPARMDAVMAALVPDLPHDAVVTFGAGNHSAWGHKFFPTRVFGSMLSTRNGSMGYSVPSAVAASLENPGRRVVSVAGDGEFMMNCNELATALQYGATPLVIVMDNGQYGTIRSHQEFHYPGRISGTQLTNPDFAVLAQGFGAYGEKVMHDGDVRGAVKRALAAIDGEGVPAVLHIVVDPAVMLP